MFIKQFREGMVRVQDPLRPNRRVFETRLAPCGGGALKHDGVTYLAEDDGWFDVPDEVGDHYRKFRGSKGEKFFTKIEVDEEVIAGRIKPDPDDEVLVTPEAKSSKKKVAA